MSPRRSFHGLSDTLAHRRHWPSGDQGGNAWRIAVQPPSGRLTSAKPPSCTRLWHALHNKAEFRTLVSPPSIQWIK
jgi:hypothetical protein